MAMAGSEFRASSAAAWAVVVRWWWGLVCGSCQHLLEASAQQLREARIRVRGQLRALAIFGDAAVVQDKDVVGALDCAEPVRDQDAGAIRKQPVDGALQQPLGCGIEPRRGFVEDHQ